MEDGGGERGGRSAGNGRSEKERGRRRKMV